MFFHWEAPAKATGSDSKATEWGSSYIVRFLAFLFYNRHITILDVIFVLYRNMSNYEDSIKSRDVSVIEKKKC